MAHRAMSYSLSAICFFLLIGIVYSQSASCPNRSFSGNRTFTNCTSLGSLNGSLHWTYDSSASTFSVAVVIPVSSRTAWIGWGINQGNSTGMSNLQALIAYGNSSGSLSVNTANIPGTAFDGSFSSIPLTVTNQSAVYVNSSMTMFATVELSNGTTSFNYAYQTGSSTTGSGGRTRLVMHATTQANLNAIGRLSLTGGSTESPTSMAPSPSGTSSSSSPGSSSLSPESSIPSTPSPGSSPSAASAAGPWSVKVLFCLVASTGLLVLLR